MEKCTSSVSPFSTPFHASSLLLDHCALRSTARDHPSLLVELGGTGIREQLPLQSEEEMYPESKNCPIEGPLQNVILCGLLIT